MTTQTIRNFAGETVTLENHVTLGSLYAYYNGQERIEFNRGDSRDWYVWSVKRQIRLATYRTRRELADAFKRSQNNHGAYSCAALSL